MINKEKIDTLYAEARKAADRAYVPYSAFRVGAALLCEDGTIVTGCNVENRSYGLAICAERTAVVSAVSQGKYRFTALAVSTPDSAEPVGPCGACRQVLSEFMSAEAQVRFAGSGSKQVDATIGDLLPWDSLYDLKKYQPDH
ncbi:MAG: cytidine deaminase [Treponema sp.]|jgi:cytidine deaminase|nr:cytidine deaminase [Treponema sp.]